MLISLNPVYPRFGENWDDISQDLHFVAENSPNRTLCQKPGLSSLEID
jgi:hypothetical protein